MTSRQASSSDALPGEERLSPSKAVEFYIEECKKDKGSPLNTFVKQLSAGSVVFNFSNSYLGGEGIKAVMRTLARVNFQVLFIANCEIDSDGVRVLADCFLFHPTLEKMDLRGNPVDVAGGRALLSLVTQTKSIQEVLLDPTVPKYRSIMQQCEKNKGLDEYVFSCMICKNVSLPFAKGPGNVQYQSVEHQLLSIVFSDYCRVMEDRMGIVEAELLLRLILLCYDYQNGCLSLCSPSCCEKLVAQFYLCINAVVKSCWYHLETFERPTLPILKHFAHNAIAEFSHRDLSEEDYVATVVPEASVLEGNCTICGTHGTIMRDGYKLLFRQLYNDVVVGKVSLSASSLKRVAENFLSYLTCVSCSLACVVHLVRFSLYGYGGVQRCFSTEEPLLSSLPVDLSASPVDSFCVCQREMTDRSSHHDAELCCALTVASAMEDIEGIPIDPYMLFALARKLNDQEEKTIGVPLRSVCQAVCLVGCLSVDESPLKKPSRPDYVSWERWSSQGETEALLHKAFSRRRQGVYIVDGSKQNAFKSVCTALWTFRAQKRCVLATVEFSLSWLALTDGVVPEELNPTTGFNTCIKVTGMTHMGEQVYLILESTFGTQAGNRGVFYMNKEMFNKRLCGVPYMFVDAAVYKNLSSVQPKKYYKSLISSPVESALQMVDRLDVVTLTSILQSSSVPKKLIHHVLALLQSDRNRSQLAFILGEMLTKDTVRRLNAHVIQHSPEGSLQKSNRGDLGNVVWRPLPIADGTESTASPLEDQHPLISLLDVYSNASTATVRDRETKRQGIFGASLKELGFQRWSILHACDAEQNMQRGEICILVGDHCCDYNTSKGVVVTPLRRIAEHPRLAKFPFPHGVSTLFHHPLRPREVYLFSDAYWCLWDAHRSRPLAGPFSVAQHSQFRKLPPRFHRSVHSAVPVPRTALVLFFLEQDCVLFDLDLGKCVGDVMKLSECIQMRSVPACFADVFKTPPVATLWSTLDWSAVMVISENGGVVSTSFVEGERGVISKLTQTSLSRLPGVLLNGCVQALPHLLHYYEESCLVGVTALCSFERFSEEQYLLKYSTTSKRGAASGEDTTIEEDNDAPQFHISTSLQTLKPVNCLFKVQYTQEEEQHTLTEETVCKGDNKANHHIEFDCGVHGEEAFGAVCVVLIRQNPHIHAPANVEVQSSVDGFSYERQATLTAMEKGCYLFLHGLWSAVHPVRYWRVAFADAVPAHLGVLRLVFYRTAWSLPVRTYCPLRHWRSETGHCTVSIEAPQVFLDANALLRPNLSPVFAAGASPSDSLSLCSLYMEEHHTVLFVSSLSFVEIALDSKVVTEVGSVKEYPLFHGAAPEWFLNLRCLFYLRMEEETLLVLFLKDGSFVCWSAQKQQRVDPAECLQTLERTIAVECRHVYTIHNLSAACGALRIVYKPFYSDTVLSVDYCTKSTLFSNKCEFSQMCPPPKESFPQAITSVIHFYINDGHQYMINQSLVTTSEGLFPPRRDQVVHCVLSALDVPFGEQKSTPVSVTVDLGSHYTRSLIVGVTLACVAPPKKAQVWTVESSHDGCTWTEMANHTQDSAESSSSWVPAMQPQRYYRLLLQPSLEECVLYTSLTFLHFPTTTDVPLAPRQIGLSPSSKVRLHPASSSSLVSFSNNGSEASKLFLDFGSMVHVSGVELSADLAAGTKCLLSVAGSVSGDEWTTIVNDAAVVISETKEFCYSWLRTVSCRFWSCTVQPIAQAADYTVQFSIQRFLSLDGPVLRHGPQNLSALLLGDQTYAVALLASVPSFLLVQWSPVLFSTEGAFRGITLHMAPIAHPIDLELECSMEGQNWKRCHTNCHLGRGATIAHVLLEENTGYYAHWRIRVGANAFMSVQLHKVDLLTSAPGLYRRLFSSKTQKSWQLTMERPTRVVQMKATLPPNSVYLLESLSSDQMTWITHATLVNSSGERPSKVSKYLTPSETDQSTQWMLRYVGKFIRPSTESSSSGTTEDAATASDVRWYGFSAEDYGPCTTSTTPKDVKCVGFHSEGERGGKVRCVFSTQGKERSSRSLTWTLNHIASYHCLHFALVVEHTSGKPCTVSSQVEVSNNGIDFTPVTARAAHRVTGEQSILLHWEETHLASSWRLSLYAAPSQSFRVIFQGFRPLSPVTIPLFNAIETVKYNASTWATYGAMVFNNDSAFRLKCREDYQTVSQKGALHAPEEWSRTEILASEVLKRKKRYQKFVASLVKEETGEGGITDIHKVLDVLDAVRKSAKHFKCDHFKGVVDLVGEMSMKMIDVKFQQKTHWFYPSMEVHGTTEAFSEKQTVPAIFMVYWSLSFELQRNTECIKEMGEISPHIAAPLLILWFSLPNFKTSFPILSALFENHVRVFGNDVGMVVASDEVTFTPEFPLPGFPSQREEVKLYPGVNFIFTSTLSACGTHLFKGMEALFGRDVLESSLVFVFTTASLSSTSFTVRFSLNGDFAKFYNVQALHIQTVEFEISCDYPPPAIDSARAKSTVSSSVTSILTSRSNKRKTRGADGALSSPVAVESPMRESAQVSLRMVGKGRLTVSDDGAVDVVLLGSLDGDTWSLCGSVGEPNDLLQKTLCLGKTMFTWQYNDQTRVPTDLSFDSLVHFADEDAFSTISYRHAPEEPHVNEESTHITHLGVPFSALQDFLHFICRVIGLPLSRKERLPSLPLRLKANFVMDRSKGLQGTGDCVFFGKSSQRMTVTCNGDHMEVQASFHRVVMGEVELTSFGSQCVTLRLLVDLASSDVGFLLSGYVDEVSGLRHIPFTVEYGKGGVIAHGYCDYGNVVLKSDDTNLRWPNARVTLDVHTVEQLLQHKLKDSPLVAQLLRRGVPFSLCLHTLEVTACNLHSLPVYTKGIFFGVFFEVALLFSSNDMDVKDTLAQRLSFGIIEMCEEALWSAYSNLVGCRTQEWFDAE
ncbi:hypothetical protein ADEAN_000552100 [Angomonas deanei]|uniref:Uncharacterized protein n=1 Tax=Angomonas deanei TaxID=59799 RepID=A0A7G2CFC4_9TRYP|nr:hypothetical protein ADEAN_000552100 [Angomonas deanei]